MSTAIQYVAEPTHVREVSLRGTADLDFWKDRLLKEDLIPIAHEGQAQILIMAATMKFMGVRFTEVSFTVGVSEPERGPRRDAAFLVQAFNSCRLFVFCERVLFATPYAHGECHVSVASPVSVRLLKSGADVFRAEMGAGSSAHPREPLRTGEDGWEGPVFLPGSRRGRGSEGHLFIARIKGHTRTYAFLRGVDTVTIRPSPDAEVLQALIASQFEAVEWAVREDAAHAKSKTYLRSDERARLFHK